MLEEFIRQFGATVYGGMARARLDELKKNQIALVTPPALASPNDPCGSATSTVSLSSRSATPLSHCRRMRAKTEGCVQGMRQVPRDGGGTGGQLHYGLAAGRSVSL